MGFRDSLKMLDVRSFLNASARKVLLYVVGEDDGSYKPVTEAMLAGGGSGGGGSDPDSAREATQAQVLAQAQATNGNTYILAQQAQGEGLHIRPPVIATLAPQALTVGSASTPLTVPAGANAATLHVVSGAVRRSIGGAPGAGTPGLGAGDTEQLRGGELAAYRLIRDGGSDAQVYIEYRTVG